MKLARTVRLGCQRLALQTFRNRTVLQQLALAARQLGKAAACCTRLDADLGRLAKRRTDPGRCRRWTSLMAAPGGAWLVLLLVCTTAAVSGAALWHPPGPRKCRLRACERRHASAVSTAPPTCNALSVLRFARAAQAFRNPEDSAGACSRCRCCLQTAQLSLTQM